MHGAGHDAVGNSCVSGQARKPRCPCWIGKEWHRAPGHAAHVYPHPLMRRALVLKLHTPFPFET
eukprot:scaffold79855_cov14-Tisochrysis_lutea.AAC.1